MIAERPVRVAGTWLLGAISAVLCLAGCASRSVDDHGRLVIYSLDGVPLSGGPLGHPTCAVALSGWLDRVDTNHDGQISRAEYLADARRQFMVMDLDKSGVLTPSELDEYRAPFTDPTTAKKSHDAPVLTADDRPDPVMAADDKMRFEVSLDQFLRYEARLFDQLDGASSGKVTRAVFLSVCNGKS